MARITALVAVSPQQRQTKLCHFWIRKELPETEIKTVAETETVPPVVARTKNSKPTQLASFLHPRGLLPMPRSITTRRLNKKV